MDLTDNEKRDAVKLIEAGKPLPDKYRFLLFGDDREVELVWNGKTAEVTNVVLPFQVIEQVDEPRSEETGGGHKQTTTLFDVDDRGRQLAGWTNKLIWDDNKLILSSLENGPFREAVTNEIIHNNYTNEIPPKFELFPNRLEITSAGGLPAEFDEDRGRLAGVYLPDRAE